LRPSPSPEGIDPARAFLAEQASVTLPRRQAAVIGALLIRHAAFQPPEPPISYGVIATALNVSVATMKTHLRRVRRNHPDLYGSVMAVRRNDFEAYHRVIAEVRRERSRRWGRRLWIAR
jgi:hypothetical protein